MNSAASSRRNSIASATATSVSISSSLEEHSSNPPLTTSGPGISGAPGAPGTVTATTLAVMMERLQTSIDPDILTDRMGHEELDQDDYVLHPFGSAGTGTNTDTGTCNVSSTSSLSSATTDSTSRNTSSVIHNNGILNSNIVNNNNNNGANGTCISNHHHHHHQHTLNTVNERMSEDNLEDCHAFTDLKNVIRQNLSSSTGGGGSLSILSGTSSETGSSARNSVNGGSLMGDPGHLLETLEEFEEDDDEITIATTAAAPTLKTLNEKNDENIEQDEE